LIWEIQMMFIFSTNLVKLISTETNNDKYLGTKEALGHDQDYWLQG
jgi:hypothetical protein